MSDEAEKQALEALVSSDGWRLFARVLSEDWSAEHVLDRLEADLGKTADPELRQQLVGAQIAIRKHIMGALAWPAYRLDQLTKASAGPVALGTRRRA